MSVLSVDNLNVQIGATPILQDMKLSVDAGQILGVVGESGSGKSLSLLSIARLLPRGAQINGSIDLAGQPILNLSDRHMRNIRGRHIGMIFQEPMSALNPVQTIGHQIAEARAIHYTQPADIINEHVLETLNKVGLADIPLSRYPHELSGGQRQRVAIAMAIINKPKLILADEPTTALDMTTQKQILNLLTRLVREDNIAMICVSHDLPLICGLADRLVILKDGQCVDATDQAKHLDTLNHPYSKTLLQAARYCPKRKTLAPDAPVLSVSNLSCAYHSRQGLFGDIKHFEAVKNVDFEIFPGETLALIGESGSGKTSLGRAILGLQPIQSGNIKVRGEHFLDAHSQLSTRPQNRLRRSIQIVFQDPYGSFNPRHKVSTLIAEPFYLLENKLDKQEKSQRVIELLNAVQLTPELAHKFPHELSGGQRQRVAIARALACNPDIIILDEALSALDVSVRARILDLLIELGEDRGLAYLFISHDLSLAKGFAHSLLVMKSGQIVERGKTHALFESPQHPYTKRLLDALPEPLT